MDNDSRYPSADEQSRELTRSISREVAKLSEQWNQLIDHSDNWKHSLDEYMTVSLLHLFHPFQWMTILQTIFIPLIATHIKTKSRLVPFFCFISPPH